MDTKERNELIDKLEIEFVDKYGLADTLDLLAEICSGKADHLRSNWQDEQTGESWDNAAGALLQTAHKLSYL